MEAGTAGAGTTTSAGTRRSEGAGEGEFDCEWENDATVAFTASSELAYRPFDIVRKRSQVWSCRSTSNVYDDTVGDGRSVESACAASDSSSGGTASGPSETCEKTTAVTCESEDCDRAFTTETVVCDDAFVVDGWCCCVEEGP